MQPSCSKFKTHAKSALANADLQSSLAKLGDGFQAKRKAAFAELPEYETLRDEAQSIKQYAMAHLDELLIEFETNVIASGGNVHWAENADDAKNTILKICENSNAKTVTKGKSMVTEELGLNNFLLDQGLTPVETDLGEYILQLRKEAPSHVVVPAVHLLQKDIEKTFLQAHKTLASDRDLRAPETLVNEARNTLRPAFIQADVGITGANYLIAETGSSVIVTNEGNGDLTQTLPKVHIVVTTIERVIPNLEDLSTFLRLLPRSATGQNATAYVTLSTGPKHQEDLAGPEEFHVVLLDNGRSQLLGSDDQDVLNCIRCGACMNHCPVYGAVGGHSYGWVYPGPIGAALTPAIIGVDKAEALPNASTFCGKCEEVCPVKIPLTHIMRHWRERAFQNLHAISAPKQLLRLWAWLAMHPKTYRSLITPAIKTLNLFAGRANKLHKLPLASGWTKHRDLPSPASSTFHAQLNQTLRHTANNGVRHE